MKFLPLLLALVVGCSTSSHIVVGTAHPKINPEQVKLYLSAPKKYEQIALPDSDSLWSFKLTNQGKVNSVIKGMKADAAKLGANGVLLTATGESGSTTIGTGVGSTYGAVGTSNVVGTSVGGLVRNGSGIAIFVIEE